MNVRMPGFTAAIVLEPTSRLNQYVGTQRGLPDNEVVMSLKSEYACGLAIGALVGGIIYGNPFAMIGGLAGIHTSC